MEKIICYNPPTEILSKFLIIKLLISANGNIIIQIRTWSYIVYD